MCNPDGVSTTSYKDSQHFHLLIYTAININLLICVDDSLLNIGGAWVGWGRGWGWGGEDGVGGWPARVLLWKQGLVCQDSMLSTHVTRWSSPGMLSKRVVISRIAACMVSSNKQICIIWYPIPLLRSAR